MLFLIKSLVVRSGVPILTKMTMMHLENGNVATPKFDKGMVSENMDINAAFGAMGCFGFTQRKEIMKEYPFLLKMTGRITLLLNWVSFRPCITITCIFNLTHDLFTS